MNLSSVIMRSGVAPDRKLGWLKITLAPALGLGFILSWRLWISSRQFPLAPVFRNLPAVPFPLDYIWFALLLGLLLMICIRAEPRKLVIMFLVLTGLLALFDQMRWQPWFYQYFFMLAAFASYAGKRPEAKNNRKALDCCAPAKRLLDARVRWRTWRWQGRDRRRASPHRDEGPA